MKEDSGDRFASCLGLVLSLNEIELIYVFELRLLGSPFHPHVPDRMYSRSRSLAFSRPAPGALLKSVPRLPAAGTRRRSHHGPPCRHEGNSALSLRPLLTIIPTLLYIHSHLNGLSPSPTSTKPDPASHIWCCRSKRSGTPWWRRGRQAGSSRGHWDPLWAARRVGSGEEIPSERRMLLPLRLLLPPLRPREQ